MDNCSKVSCLRDAVGVSPSGNPTDSGSVIEARRLSLMPSMGTLSSVISPFLGLWLYFGGGPRPSRASGDDKWPGSELERREGSSSSASPARRRRPSNLPKYQFSDMIAFSSGPKWFAVARWRV